MSVHFMEEHLQAYFLWKELGIHKAWCWHVDAHLDIGKAGLGPNRLAALKGCSTYSQAKQQDLLGNSYLPWGGLHCGNYLYPAIQEGIVGRLTWVIPPDLPEGNLLVWARQHINDWFELSLQEFASLRLEGKTVVGELLGIPFQMGTLEELPLPEFPVLFDVDIDYFLLESGQPWAYSKDFLQATQSISKICSTVALSVKGGFTPESERSQADAFGPYESRRDADHTITPLDELAAKVRCHAYEDALSMTLCDDENRIEVAFLRGTSFQALGRPAEALQVWIDLLGLDQISQDGRAYLHGLCSELLLEAQKPREALKHSMAAQKIAPSDYRHFWTEAVAREALGEQRKALRLLRKTVSMSEHVLFGLKARYALSRIYKQQDKLGLAKIELQKLAQLDVTGKFRAATML